MKKRTAWLIILLLILLCFSGCSAQEQDFNQNLLTNPGFESAGSFLPDDWSLDRYDTSEPLENYAVVSDDSAPEGTQVVSIKSAIKNDVRLTQSVSVVPDSYYCLSAWIKTEDVGSETGAKGANLSILNSYACSEELFGNTEWTHVKLYGKTASNQTSLSVCLRLGFYSGDNSGTAFFDSAELVRLEACPETVTASDFGEFSATVEKPTNDTRSQDTANVVVTTAVISGLLFFAAAMVFSSKKQLSNEKLILALLLGAAAIIRIIIAYTNKGFSVDINCFTAWGNIMCDKWTGFYSATWCDYPPLYMVFLGILSAVRNLLFPALDLTGGVALLIIKLPAICCDILTAILLFKLGKKYIGAKIGLLVSALYLFNPAIIVNSASWGQVDSILVLLLSLAFWFMSENKYPGAVLIYLVAVLTKPQAIVFGPVMFFGLINEINTCVKTKQLKSLLPTIYALLGALAAFVGISLLFQDTQESPFWLINNYISTIGANQNYDYGSLSSFGLSALLGGQWTPATQLSPLGISYSLLGTLGVGVTVVIGFGLYFLRLKKHKHVDAGFLWLLGAFICAGAVILGARAHERYLFPVLAMLLFAFVYLRDRRLLFVFGGFSALQYINTALTLRLWQKYENYLNYNEDAILQIGSALIVIVFIYFAFVTISILIKNAKEHAPKNEEPHDGGDTVAGDTDDSETQVFLAQRTQKKIKFDWKDFVIILIIMAVYGTAAFTNLGDTKAAENFWYTNESEYFTVADLGETTEINDIRVLSDMSSGAFEISCSSDGKSFTKAASMTMNAETVGTWAAVPDISLSARYIKISATKAPVSITEMVFLNNGEYVPVKSTTDHLSPVSPSGSALFDNPESYFTLPSSPVSAFEASTPFSCIVNFEKPASINDLFVFSDAAESSFTLQLEYFSQENNAWFPFADFFGNYLSLSTWDSGFLANDLPQTVSTLRIRSADSNFSLNEMVFLSGAETVNVLSVTDENGELAENGFEKCFDEQDSYIAFAATKTWKITALSDYVVADFGTTTPIQRMYYYTSICSGSFSVYYYNGATWELFGAPSFEMGDMYAWHLVTPETEVSAQKVAVVADSAYLRLLEMGFYSAADATAPIKIVSTSGGTAESAALFDEQDCVPLRPSYMNSMYFDEIYHARTAYESLHDMNIYEWTHPPLGKDIMSWGVAVFGMNPFGWRFTGTLMGLLMLPAMYFLGKLMFKKRIFATALTLLMTLDGMHFVQTRIATIDSYALLFIICMFLFMYWYQRKSFYNAPLWKTFIPLGLAGISFGLAAASKWIGLYAGAGLAVIFFVCLFSRYREYKLAKAALASGKYTEDEQYLTHVCNSFYKNTGYTILFCILFFVIIPLIIYCASYYPYINYAHTSGDSRAWYQIILDNQSAMYSYHSQLEATHAFQSPWYSWPVIYRPIWFYAGAELPADSLACISSFGNPAVWYSGLAATIASFVLFIRKIFSYKRLQTLEEKLIGRKELGFLLFVFIGLFANLGPWMLVNRCIFIYHYFATLPFIMILTVYLFKKAYQHNKKKTLIGMCIFFALALALFVLFFPIWSGLEIDKSFVKDYLTWFPSWYFGA